MMRLALGLVLLFLTPGLFATATPSATGETLWWQNTMLDLDRDGIDDALLPLLDGDTRLRVLVAYATMPGGVERAALEAHGAAISSVYTHFPIIAVDVHPRQVVELLQLEGVIFVERDDAIHPLLRESVPLTGAPLAWQRYEATGKGIVVAVLDDGAYEQHPDFAGKIVASHNSAVSALPLPGQVIDASTGPAGVEGHGTHVAGTVVGNGNEAGGTYRGVAPDARFANVRVFDAPDQTRSELVLRGLDWTLSNMERHGIRIAVMSLGGTPSDGTDALSRGVNIAVDKGLIVMAAAGNAGPDGRTVGTPGAAEKAITVGAVDKHKQVAIFSSRGPTIDGRMKPDLVAPGTEITSTVPPTSTTATHGVLTGQTMLYYGSLSGTSMAAPHVAGVAAMMLEVNPGLRPIDVKRMLLATAQDLGEPNRDNATGYGFVNAIAAVQVANDPRLLDNPRFAAIFATFPDPERETALDRLAADAGTLARTVTLPMIAGLAAALLIGLVLVVGIVRQQNKP